MNDSDRLDDTGFDTLLEVGWLALDERMFDEAESLFAILAKHHPDKPYPRIGLALLKYSEGRRIEAIDALKQVLGDFPDAVFSRALLANWLKESGMDGWRRLAEEALERVQEGVAADMARELLAGDVPASAGAGSPRETRPEPAPNSDYLQDRAFSRRA